MNYIRIFFKSMTLWIGIIFISMSTFLLALFFLGQLPEDVSIYRVIFAQVVCLLTGGLMLWISSFIKHEPLEF